MLVKLYELKNESIDYEMWLDTNGIVLNNLQNLVKKYIPLHTTYLETCSYNNIDFFITYHHAIEEKISKNKLIHRGLFNSIEYCKRENKKKLIIFDTHKGETIQYADNMDESVNSSTNIVYSTKELKGNGLKTLMKYVYEHYQKLQENGGKNEVAGTNC